MTARPIIPVIDYTSRDYEAIRADMIRLIRERLPQWTADDPNDFGVALVESFAYAADQMHYYLDRIVNEAYLGTATQRESISAIARMFGYVPYTALPSRATLELGNTTGADIVVPWGARFQATLTTGDETLIRSFEILNDIEDAPEEGVRVPAGGVATVDATEGRTYRNEQVGISTGTPFQRFTLPRSSVLPESVQVQVVLRDVVTTYTATDRLDTKADDDRSFVVEQHADGTTTILFGDGLNGAIPALHGTVEATYRAGGGKADVPANAINTVVDPRIPGLTVTNPLPAAGGRDNESLQSIRVNAARAFRAPIKRAVTLEDYVNLAKTYPGVAKAKATANNGVSVVVWATPADDGSGRPLLTPTERKSLALFLQASGVVGTSVTVMDPVYYRVFLKIDAYCADNFRQSEVRRGVERALTTLFDYDNINFDDRLTVQDLMTAFYNVRGLAFAQIRSMSTSPSPDSLEPLDFARIKINALPYFDLTSLQLSMHGGTT